MLTITLINTQQNPDWLNTTVEVFYRRMLAVLPQQGVCLSVHPSVRLSCRDHIGWNFSKIISRLLVSLGCSLSADPNFTDLLQGEHPEILAGIGYRLRKSEFRRTIFTFSFPIIFWPQFALPATHVKGSPISTMSKADRRSGCKCNI